MARKRRQKSKFVIINNPLPGGSTYTSLRKAQDLVKRGRAAWDSSRSIYLLPEKLTEQLAQAEGGIEVDSAIEQYRGGVVFWNGADRASKAKHKPGEVRS